MELELELVLLVEMSPLSKIGLKWSSINSSVRAGDMGTFMMIMRGGGGTRGKVATVEVINKLSFPTSQS